MDSKRNYFHNLAYSNTKDFWKTIKTLNKNKTTIPALQLGNCTAESDSEKAQMLNTFSASCWNTSEEPIKDLNSWQFAILTEAFAVLWGALVVQARARWQQ